MFSIRTSETEQNDQLLASRQKRDLANPHSFQPPITIRLYIDVKQLGYEELRLNIGLNGTETHRRANQSIVTIFKRALHEIY